ncbi:MAG TPA: hypothetical protein VEX11_14530 [Acetobacteraceae bacterium]|nr:hypothetical protein [Acetobacteraceae bacterium]
MPIVVDSSQWTGEHDDAPMASPVVWGEFAEAAEVDRVAERLQAESWFRDAQAAPAPEAAPPGWSTPPFRRRRSSPGRCSPRAPAPRSG